MSDNAGKYVLVVEGAIPTRDDGVYMQLAGRPAVQVVKEVAAESGGGDRDGFVRVVGRNSFIGSESDGRGGRGHGDIGQTDRQLAGLPTQSLQPAGGGAGVRDDGQVAAAGRSAPAEIRLRARDSRELSAAGAF